jgi:hypothetical protein
LTPPFWPGPGSLTKNPRPATEWNLQLLIQVLALEHTDAASALHDPLPDILTAHHSAQNPRLQLHPCKTQLDNPGLTIQSWIHRPKLSRQPTMHSSTRYDVEFSDL